MNPSTRNSRYFPGLALVSLATACVVGAALTGNVAGAAATQAAPMATPLADPVPLASAAELAAVAARIPGAKAADLAATPIAGLYELRQGGDVVYVTADGRYGFSGDIYRLADKANLTAERRRALRLELLGKLDESSSMVVFAPEGAPRYTVTVFTDVDCGYCRKLHTQIADYNKLGVKVRYLFYPRTGPNTESWTKAEQVWCSADRRAALTQAKMGAGLPAKPCQPNPVAQDYQLGREIGLEGTPGIISESGELYPGYLPPDSLVRALEGEKKKPAGG